jgi:formylmethanofuran dehydrogenase subunit E
MAWLPYDNEDLCVGSLQYVFCNYCGTMLTSVPEYTKKGEPVCQECFAKLKIDDKV